MRSSAGAGNDHLEAALFGALGVLIKAIGRAVSADHLGFVGNLELIEHLGGAFHGGPVRKTAHDDADLGLPNHGLTVGVVATAALRTEADAMASQSHAPSFEGGHCAHAIMSGSS